MKTLLALLFIVTTAGAQNYLTPNGSLKIGPQPMWGEPATMPYSVVIDQGSRLIFLNDSWNAAYIRSEKWHTWINGQWLPELQLTSSGDIAFGVGSHGRIQFGISSVGSQQQVTFNRQAAVSAGVPESTSIPLHLVTASWSLEWGAEVYHQRISWKGVPIDGFRSAFVIYGPDDGNAVYLDVDSDGLRVASRIYAEDRDLLAEIDALKEQLNALTNRVEALENP